MKRFAAAAFAVSLILPASGFAQGGGEVRAWVAPAGAPQGAVAGIVAGPVESKITPGRPYSADAITERNQVLSDGNRISVSSTTKIYRDSEGRTRREMYGADGTLRSVSISDPVARVSYTLDPAKKIAFKTSGSIATPAMAPAAGSVVRNRIELAPDGTTTVSPARTPAPATAGGAAVAAPAAAAAGGGGRGGSMVSLPRSAGPEDPNTKKEDLGSQNIDGVMATGTRTTTTIPAGQIGNAQDIRVVSEQWFSEDLQVLVMTRHADPRSGENTYRLRNVHRAEPDPSLFTVPADYTVQERGVRRPE